MNCFLNPQPIRLSHPRQRGMALVATLMALSMMTLIGLTMTFVTATETLINHNSESRLVNLYLAESAIEEGRSKLPGALPVAANEAVYIRYNSTIDPTAGSAATNPYFDPAFNTNGMTSSRFIDSDLTQVGFAWVRISLKTEDRAGYLLDDDSGNNSTAVNYGYDNSAPTLVPFQFVGSPAAHYGSSVYLLTAMALDGSGSKQMVRSEVARLPMPPISAALYNKDKVHLKSAGVTIDGNDGNGGTDLAGIDTPDVVEGDTSQVTGNPDFIAGSSSNHNIAALIKLFGPPVSIDVQSVDSGVSFSSGTYTGTDVSFGEPGTSNRVPTFVDGNLVISGDSEGHGFLIVNGDLEVDGSFHFDGVLIVNGVVDLDGYPVGGSPGIQINGAIISHPESSSGHSDFEGNIWIRYFSQAVGNQFQTLKHARLSYREISSLN